MGINKLEITGLFPGRMRRMLEDISLDFDQLEEAAPAMRTACFAAGMRQRNGN